MCETKAALRSFELLNGGFLDDEKFQPDLRMDPNLEKPNHHLLRKIYLKIHCENNRDD